MSLKFTTIPQKRLLQGITSTSSSFYLNNIFSWDGETDLTAADFGTIHYCAFRNDNGTLLELMEIDPSTIIAGGAITINKRGLSFNGDLTTETASLKLDWPVNTICMLGTDVPQIFQWLKEYIDGIAIAGAPDATTTIKGLVKMSVAPASASSPIAVGTNDSRVPVAYAVDSKGTDDYEITPSPTETAYVTGKEYTFKAGTANTGACSLNVSGLGAKTIKKDVSSDLVTGDILQNQIVVCKFDGTNMQMISKTPSLTNTQVFTSSGTYTKNPMAKMIKVIAFGAGGNGGAGRTDRNGTGGGGGGGARIEKDLIASSISNTVSVTVATPGSTPSSFGTYLYAYNGANGNYTDDYGNNGNGGGGGSVSNGFTGSTSTAGAGGVPTALTNAISTQGATGAFNSEMGGAGGGSISTGGGSSIFGGPGGGGGAAGGGNGGAGGTIKSYTNGGGGTGGTGASPTINNATSGTAGISRSGTGYAGDGGGGGGAGNGASGHATDINGGNGGNGGIPSGGGGGGGGTGSPYGVGGTPGTGGTGGCGEVIVIEYF